MPAKPRDAEYWLDRAIEAREAAETMRSPDAKRDLMKIVATYERLAERVERTAGKKPRRE